MPIRIDKDSRLTLHLASGGGFAMKLELCPVHGQVTSIPEGKNIPSFYQKYIETEGLYVTSSGKVSDEALLNHQFDVGKTSGCEGAHGEERLPRHGYR